MYAFEASDAIKRRCCRWRWTIQIYRKYAINLSRSLSFHRLNTHVRVALGHRDLDMRRLLAFTLFALSASQGFAAPPLACEMIGSQTVFTVTGSSVYMRTGEKSRTLPAQALPQDHEGWPRVWLLQEPPSAHMLLVSESTCKTDYGTFPLSVSLNTLGLGQRSGCCTIAE